MVKRRYKLGGQGELEEERHSLAGLDRLVLGFHVRDRTAEPHDLARHHVAKQREIGGPPTRIAQQAAAGAVVDAEQLAQLAAGPRREKPRHLVFDLSRERNRAYLQEGDLTFPPSSLTCDCWLPVHIC